jgi:hypothetical protein
LRIDRIYEHGEFLAYLRFVQRQFAPPSTCNPQIRSFRFDTIRGGPIEQHKLSTLIVALLRSSSGAPENVKRADLPENPDCQSPEAVPGSAIGSASLHS